VAVIAAVVAVNALLLGYGGERNDRVGTVSPGCRTARDVGAGSHRTGNDHDR